MPSFAKDIRPLFRPDDVEAMNWALDLSDYDAVKENAQAIYDQVAAGSMPCDGAWPKDRVALFKQWMDEGSAP
jgi:hypothetical protein